MVLTHNAIKTLVLSWTFAFLATIFTIGLICSRHLGRLPVTRFDDLLFFAAYICSLALVSVTTWAISQEGQGEHIDNVTQSEAAWIAKSLFANELLWGFIHTLLRCSACRFNLRVVGIERRYGTAIVISIAISIVHWFVTLMVSLLICKPARKAWKPTLSGRCGSEILSYVWLESAGLLIDVIVVIVPLVGLRNVQISRKRKLRILGLFAIGLLVVIITGLRIHALHDVTSADFLYSKNSLGLLSALGVFVAIILGTALSFPQLIHQLKLKLPTIRTSFAVGKRTHGQIFTRNARPKFKKNDVNSSEIEMGPPNFNTKSTNNSTHSNSGDVCDVRDGRSKIETNHVKSSEIEVGSPDSDANANDHDTRSHFGDIDINHPTTSPRFNWSYRLGNLSRLVHLKSQECDVSWQDTLHSREGSDPIPLDDFQWLLHTLRVALANYVFWDGHQPTLNAVHLRCLRRRDEEQLQSLGSTGGPLYALKLRSMDIFAAFTDIVPGSPPRYLFTCQTGLQTLLENITSSLRTDSESHFDLLHSVLAASGPENKHDSVEGGVPEQELKSTTKSILFPTSTARRFLTPATVPSPYIVTVEQHSFNDKSDGAFHAWYQCACQDLLADAAGFKHIEYSISNCSPTLEIAEQQRPDTVYRLDRFEILHRFLPESAAGNPIPWVAKHLEDGKALVVRGLRLSDTGLNGL
ncbi:MAG: hypothetical protein M1820_004716 [Bogoriella megaspora]|nr:MAG: hypothetical protein M1820_004716 [Bogoriella megaspora]